jgi:alpha-L-arabinofuranosidase
MHSIHMYTASTHHISNATGALAAEKAIVTAAALIDLARIANGVPPDQHQVTICFDEWNIWDAVRAEGSKGAEERYTLSDALGVAIWLNVFVRQAQHLGMACIAQSVNVISPLMTSKDGVVKQTIWWPLWLFARYMHGYTVAVHVRGSTYDGELQSSWGKEVVNWKHKDRGISWLDVSACVDEGGYVNLVVVNVSEEESFETEMEGVGARGDSKVQVFTVSGKDVTVTNMDGTEEVGVVESTWDGRGNYTFGKHSMTMMRWKA